jgi:hypothetical protein
MTTEKEKEASRIDITPSQIQKERRLTAEEINALIEKYKDAKPEATIVGKEPYEPFLAGIEDDTWMSVGDEVKED